MSELPRLILGHRTMEMWDAYCATCDLELLASQPDRKRAVAALEEHQKLHQRPPDSA